MEKLAVILAAAGLGKRLGLGKNKAFVFLDGAPIIAHNLRELSSIEQLGRVVIVVRENEIAEAEELLHGFQGRFFPGVDWCLAVGGAERQDSVYNALKLLKDSDGYVAVHDGARPFATADIFYRAWQAALVTGAAIAAVPVKDTIKVVDAKRQVLSTPDRGGLRAVQTPQVFALPLLRKAYAKLYADGAFVTDDAGAVERIGVCAEAVDGSYENIKITTPEDLLIAEAMLRKRRNSAEMLPLRVGNGFDVHRLVPGRKLIICGVNIPYELGLEGHSDADVALHALMDAMLGAVGLGDIGRHFPDTDAAYKDADSMQLLRHVVQLLAQKGWRVGNADVTIIAQKPKMAPYREAMEANLCRELDLGTDALNVKATTTEGLGYTGRGEGIAAQAVVSVVAV